ncbi:MAG: efflux RND transporter periplasmic adaptor subunit [Bacteroidota bacterium]|nr:efflux RND transporter periplasmic adaptor subunit [Bacteroidota bacterium]
MARKKNSNKVLIILGSIAVLLIILAVVGKSAGWIGKPKETEVDVSSVKRMNITELVSASGMVQPEKEVKISPDVPGEIIQLHIIEGDSVVQGQLLIKIRPDNYQSALARMQANLNQQKANHIESQARLSRAEAQFTLAEQAFKRNKDLFKEKVISTADFQQAEAEYKIAAQDLESSKQNVEAAKYMVQSAAASVKEANENLSLTNIYAPANGTVSKLNVEQGERVVGTSQMAGTEMLRIADLTQMEVRVDVNENDIIRISRGDTAIIDVDSYSHTKKKFKGVVTAIANTAKDKVSSDAITEFEVRIKILNDSFKDVIQGKRSASPFRPGMTASVDIITQKKNNILTIPLSSVTTRNPEAEEKNENAEEAAAQPVTNVSDNSNRSNEEAMKEVVFINDNGKAKMVAVETGISDYDNIEILGGLNENDQVIAGPFQVVSKKLKDGEPIKVAEKKP